MIRKIISGGRTDPERGALDAALKYGVPHAGWIHYIRGEERKKLLETYHLTVIPALDPRAAVRQNVEHTDGTLILTTGKPRENADYARHLTLKRGMQLLGIDMRQYAPIEAGSLIVSWLKLNHVSRVYVTGSDDETRGRSYNLSRKIMEAAIILGYTRMNAVPARNSQPRQGPGGAKAWPATVEDAVKRLIDELFLRDKNRISTMEPPDLDELHPTLGRYIRENYGLLSGNHELLKSCMRTTQASEIVPDEASAIIIKELWQELQQTHRIRIAPPASDR
ncbi:MAG: putative molybdenum carrier protein [Deltaproteobacteria bacterium]|nr:putative molybdenum carrier protein [Deltaproteobacteria bacterium]